MICVTRLRPSSTSVDGYGDPVEVFVETTLECRGIAPRHSGEDSPNGRQGVPIGWDLYCAHGVDIQPTDRVRLEDGTLCEVDGEPAQWFHMMTGWEAGAVIALKRYEG